MSAAPFMQLYVADYFGDTMHLTTEQHGAYLLILMTMWRTPDCRLPNDPHKLARVARLSSRRWHLIADDVMAFFDVDGDSITQKRLFEEHQKAVSISEKRSVSGKLGGEAKALKNKDAALAIAKQMQKHSQISDIRREEEPNGSLSETSSDTRKKRKEYPEGFESAWLSYPRDPNMSKAEAFDAWKKLDAADKDALAASIPAFVAYCRANPDYRPIHMCRYIAKRRFDGHGKPTQAPGTDEATWQKRLRFARARQTWSALEWGPRPNSPGCMVPQHLIQPTDGHGWAEFRQEAA